MNRDLTSSSVAELRRHLEEARLATDSEGRRAVFLQEELDWTVYALFALDARIPLLPATVLDAFPGIETDQRPFKWDSSETVHSLPIQLRQVYAKRHRLIEENSNLCLLETDVFKRPWLGRRGVYGQASATYEDQTTAALREWLLARLEGYFFEAHRVCRLEDAFSPDAHGFGATTRAALVSTTSLPN